MTRCHGPSGWQFQCYRRKVGRERPDCALKERAFPTQEICMGAARVRLLKPSMVHWLTGTPASMQMAAVPKTMRQTRTQWLLSPSSLRDMQTSLENIDCPIDAADWRERPVGLHQDTFFTPDVLIKAYWPKWDPSYSGNIEGESAQAVLHGHTQKCQVSISNWQIPPSPARGSVTDKSSFNILRCINLISSLLGVGEADEFLSVSSYISGQKLIDNKKNVH